MKYPINSVTTRTFTIPAGQQSARLNISIKQQQPKILFSAFMDHEAKSGSWTKDPFNFKPFNISSMILDVDGQPLPSKPIQLDFSINIFTVAYQNLGVAIGKEGSDEDHGITRNKFANGYTIFAFDLTPVKCEGGGVHLIRTSSVTLELELKQVLANAISVFALEEKDDLIEIDSERVIHRLTRL